MHADNRRITARVVLFMVVAVIMTLVLFAGGPNGAISFAQQQTTPPGPKIEWLNPDADSSNEVSAKDDTSGATTSGSYHLVATVTGLPASPTVVFRYQDGDDAPIDIGPATPVGSDTYEFHWPGNSMPADGTYDLIASLRSSGTEVASDTEEAEVNNTTEPGPGGIPNPDPTTNQAETVEITNPVNGGSLNFTDPAGDPRFTATIQVKHSADVTEVEPYYTVSAPGTEPTWTECEGGTETAAEAADGVDCELAEPDFPTQVTGIAVVAYDEPTDPIPGADAESGDAHRVTGIGASPSPTASTTSPSPTASTTSPSPTASSASPSPSESSASPSPSASTPPPPIAYSSQTTIKYNGKAFTGKVKSDHKKCRKGRKVVLKKEKKSGGAKKVGSDKTNKRGNYKIREPKANGTYFTVAKAKGFTDNAGRQVTCGQDRSKKKKV